MSAVQLSIAKDFSRFPAGRFETDGPYSGERFRKLLVDKLRQGHVTVLLDGTVGYGSSFLEEAFGGLVREEGFQADDLKKRLTIKATDASLVREAWSYVDQARSSGRRAGP